MPLRKLLAFALSACAAPFSAHAATNDAAREQIETVVVTAEAMDKPGRVETDPHHPRQPLPAHDGADYLKTIPGFNLIRKGGADADPVFRGMAASRVNILLDGSNLTGGCSMRMDPPTAYVYPEAYDRISVIKGPQSVIHGPGNSAATVLFERSSESFTEAGWKARASATAASFGRLDEVLNLRGGARRGYAELTGTHARSDDYSDGDGNRVHSRYQRWNVNGALGWTPDENTRVELSGAASDGEAAYADRSMDGAEFSRRGLSLKLERRALSPRLQKLEAQLYYNYIDHVMDNYSLRAFHPSMMMPNPSASNPDRSTLGARAIAEIDASSSMLLKLGIDHQQNRHRVRSTMNQDMMPYEDMSRDADAGFRNTGLFGELEYRFDERRRMVSGLRADYWRAEDKREVLSFGMMMSIPNPDAGATRHDWLPAAFLRYEHDAASAPLTAYAGIGHVQRFPDYWEAFAGKETQSTPSAFDIESEKTTQLDLGLIYRGQRLELSASAFANRIDDYILIEANYRKGMRLATIARNVDAKSIGGELSVAWHFSPAWKADATLAWTRAWNDDDGGPLAQQPPLEARFGAGYDDGRRSFGALLRLVDDQHRVALNQGNVVGQDFGPSSGFAVVSLNALQRIGDRLEISAGVDNLFDNNYAEHISRGGAMLAGYTQTERVGEPGRTAWLRLAYTLD